MSSLLKYVCRNYLRFNRLYIQPISSRQYSQKQDVTKSQIVNLSLQDAKTPSAVLSTVQQHSPYLEPPQLMQAFRTLFELHKSYRYADFDRLIKDPGFNMLCEKLKKHSRSLEPSEVIEAIKILSFLRVPIDTQIVQILLQLIKYQINELNIRQVMFLHFILKKTPKKNHLVDALNLALPLVFQIHLPLEIDNQDLNLLREMLFYASTNNISDRCIDNIVTGLLLHDQAFSGQIAKSIIWSLCEMNCNESLFPTRVQLLHICFDILCQNMRELSSDDLLRTAAKLKNRLVERHMEYYHEGLMDAIADAVVEKRLPMDKAVLVARTFSRIAHSNINILKYICNLIADDPELLSNARTNLLLSFVNCLSNNDYRPEPETWNKIKNSIKENPVLSSSNNELPWIKLGLELASLNHYEDLILNRIFDEVFLQKFLQRKENYLDHIQLLTLYEAVKCFYSDEYNLPEDVLLKGMRLYPVNNMSEQLQSYLAIEVGGGEYLARNVVLDNGMVADVLLCVKDGQPVNLPTGNQGKTPIRELNLPPDGKIICLLGFHKGCYTVNNNRLRSIFRLVVEILDKKSYVAIPVNLHEWSNIPDHEKAPYLYREIDYKCTQANIGLISRD